MKLPRPTVISVIHRVVRQRNVFSLFKKRMSRFSKLNDREKRTFVRHIEKIPHDNFAALATSSKSSDQLFRNIVRKYMKFAGFLRFKTRKKSYLTIRHKIVCFVWARKHKHWSVKNWNKIVWTNETTYETELNTRSCYVSRRKKIVMETKYLKPTFKNKQSIINVWKFIIFDTKDLMHVLTKKRRMNSNIYINEILKSIKLPFFKRYLVSNKTMIWMNDKASYHISKKMFAWKRLNDL